MYGRSSIALASGPRRTLFISKFTASHPGLCWGTFPVLPPEFVAVLLPHIQTYIEGGGGGGLIATKSSEGSRFKDALGVTGMCGIGDRKAVQVVPNVLGMFPPLAWSEPGVRGTRAGGQGLRKAVDADGGGTSETSLRCLRSSGGVFVCVSETADTPLLSFSGHGRGPSWGVCARPDGRGGGVRQGCIRREGTSEAAPEAVRQAVGGGCQSGWGGYCRLQVPWRPALGVGGGQWLGVGWAPWRRRGGYLPAFQCIPGAGSLPWGRNHHSHCIISGVQRDVQ